MDGAADKPAARRWGLLLLAIGLTMGLATLGISFAVASYQGLDYKCIVEGPFSPVAAIGEASGVVTGQFGLWPLGRECEWLRADGEGTVVANSGDWTGTFAIGVSVGIVVAGMLLIARRPVAPRLRR
jgi:hypothetical protein